MEVDLLGWPTVCKALVWKCASLRRRLGTCHDIRHHRCPYCPNPEVLSSTQALAAPEKLLQTTLLSRSGAACRRGWGSDSAVRRQEVHPGGRSSSRFKTHCGLRDKLLGSSNSKRNTPCVCLVFRQETSSIPAFPRSACSFTQVPGCACL